MDGKAIHRCLHVLDLEKSIAFYEKALGMTEIRRMGPEDGSWTNVFMGNATSGFQLELTWNRGRTEPYDCLLYTSLPCGSRARSSPGPCRTSAGRPPRAA